MNKFTRFYNFLANMGLVIRDDPPKVIDMTGREFGDPVDGLTLSIRELPRDEDPRLVSGISVVMKNGGSAPKTLSAPPWIFFYKVEGLDLSPYGRQFMNSDQKAKSVDVTLCPGDAIETHLPVGTVYNMRASGQYRVRISCTLSSALTLRSNEITVRV